MLVPADPVPGLNARRFVPRQEIAGGPMAILIFNVKNVSRGRGSNAVSRAAYISRDKLRDERLNRSFDFRARGGLEHSEILLPAKSPAAVGDWARDRPTLWNEAEAAEGRRNARVAREYVVALPHELSARDRLELARGFAQGLADRYSVAADLAVHTAPPGGDPRNHHAHVLTTTRELLVDGLGRKTDVELNDESRRERGLPSAAEGLRLMRHAWADRVNEQLREANLAVIVDARSYWEQGVARVPQSHFGPGLIALERSGVQTQLGANLREEHAARQQLMLEYERAHRLRVTHLPVASVQTGASLAAGPDAASAHAADPVAPDRQSSVAPLSLDERRQRAAELWLTYRKERELGADRGARASLDRGRDHGADFEM